MKKLLLGAVALVGLGLGGTSAMAADMPIYKAPPPLPVWTWAGAYFGAHAGGAWGKSHWATNFENACGNPVVGAPCVGVDQSPGGWVVGGQLGARWQWGGWVLGLEATLAATDIRASDPSQRPGAAAAGVHYDTRIGNLYTATAQIGYAFNRTLWYVKGGYAGGEVDVKHCIQGPGTCVSPAGAPAIGAGGSRQANGWTVGTGIEYLVLQNLSLGIEYDYIRLNAGDFASCPGGVRFCNAAGSLPLIASDFRADIHQVVARANYRLDWGILWGAPAPAR